MRVIALFLGCLALAVFTIGVVEVEAGSKSKKRVRIGGAAAGAAVIGGASAYSNSSPSLLTPHAGYEDYRNTQSKNVGIQPGAVDEAIAVFSPQKIGLPSVGGVGSGFAVSRDGYIVTNHHVIEGGQHFMVRDAKAGVAYFAELIRYDEKNDLALLKSEINSYPISVTSETAIRIGEEVVAFGFPKPSVLGFQMKVTFGRVNALSGMHGEQGLFQIDAVIQPGNSGGPLISRSGQLVGVNTSIFRDHDLVAYAVKPDYISAFLQGYIGSVPYSPRAHMEIPDLVEQIEPSVFQILTYK